MKQDRENPSPARTFADEANRKSTGALAELISFMRHNKKWWLAPILILLLLVGALAILNTTALAPFIYSFY